MNVQSTRINMIKQQLRTGDVIDESILKLFREIARDEFVPTKYKDFAYSDMQLELPHQQRMMTPLEEAKILQALNLTGNETVLEVGTGTGFLTTLLSRKCKKLMSIDYFSDFTANAKINLNKYKCNNVELITGDAHKGWLEKAPYDVIVFTGSLEKLTETHLLQIVPGGKLFAIIGKAPLMQGQLHTLDKKGNWHKEVIFETNIPCLINEPKPNGFIF